MWLNRLLKVNHIIGAPLPYLYAAAVYFALREVGENVDIDALIDVINTIKPWTIDTFTVGVTKIKKSKLVEIIRKIEDELKKANR